MNSLREMLEDRMDTQLNGMRKEISLLSDRTLKRLDGFESKLKKVEADTYWKISEYEKLLEARPTLQYVKSAIAEEARNALVESRIYTDQEIAKIEKGVATGGGGGGGDNSELTEIFNEFSEKTDGSIDHLTKKINELEALQKKTDGDLRGLITTKETGLQKQIDEIKALSDKLSEELKALQIDVEGMKEVGGEVTIGKDGNPTISARGSAGDIRKSTS